MKFTKMQGTCNDFIVINNEEEKISAERMPELTSFLCQRRVSVGADGMMFISKATKDADVKMNFYNADGSRGEMCGNGVRCAAKYSYDNGLYSDSRELRIETDAGTVKVWPVGSQHYRVRLNPITKVEPDITLELEDRSVKGWYIELGNPGLPHFVLFYDGLRNEKESALWHLGRQIRQHSTLKRGANVNFVQITGWNSAFIKTFERGVEDFTYACGTGAGAVAAVLSMKGIMSGRCIEICSAGGTLKVDPVEKDGVIKDLFLTGEAVTVYEGEIR